ncbi:M15 family metallopeptidase [Mucilaginibacter sabulilitoris]|uniref:M15 family metallopeptidase n=1 Tax=Mucilaginibacter sabulilitoris TaxID=1173583 RepID=A0ABZ0TTT5_9SPHI|nr:M15 family metallopeptidase [Mucilaginibacter sabulilitoris]WPU96282.1 M15 family metallopeptidase [Mucilaginibacter sabulilitoris]
MDTGKSENKKGADPDQTSDSQIDAISKKLDKLLEKDNSGKDAWDKFGIISSFISSVLIAIVGLTYTMVYDRREKESQAQAQKQATELQTLISLSSKLSSKDSSEKKTAREILQAYKNSQSGSKSENKGESIINNYIALAFKADAPEAQRVSATNKIAALATSPNASKTDKEKIINTVTALGKSTKAPKKVQDAANKALFDIITKNNEAMVGLQPEVAQLAKKLIAQAKDAGINTVITSGYRSPALQDSLYKAGLTKLKGAYSSHSKGLAFDLVPYRDGKIVWDDTEDLKKLGEMGVKLGLTWGGNYNFMKDLFHFELAPNTNGASTK